MTEQEIEAIAQRIFDESSEGTYKDWSREVRDRASPRSRPSSKKSSSWLTRSTSIPRTIAKCASTRTSSWGRTGRTRRR